MYDNFYVNPKQEKIIKRKTKSTPCKPSLLPRKEKRYGH